MMVRSLEEIQGRAVVPLKPFSPELRKQCVCIAREKSPSAAFDRGFNAAMIAGSNQREALAIGKATRWLAVIRRDYGNEKFEDVAKTLA